MTKYDRYGTPSPEEEQQYDQYGTPIPGDQQYDQYGQPLHVAEPRPAQPSPPTGTLPSGLPGLLVGAVVVVLLLLCTGVGIVLYTRSTKPMPELPISQLTTTPTAEKVTPPTVEQLLTPIEQPPTPTKELPPIEPIGGDLPSVVVPSPVELGGLSPEEAERIRQEVEEAINRHNRLRVEGLRTNDPEIFKQIKAGEELAYQLGNVNYYISTNSYWEIQLKEMIIDSFIIHDPQHVEVALTKLETGLFYYNGSTDPHPEESYYDDRYNMGYVMEKADGTWYVTKITGVKDREY